MMPAAPSALPRRLQTDGAWPPCFQNMHAVRHVKSTNTWQKGHQDTKQKSEMTRVRRRHRASQRRLTSRLQVVAPAVDGQASLVCSCHGNTAMPSGCDMREMQQSMVDTGRHSRARNNQTQETKRPTPRKQAASSPRRPTQANRPPGSRRKRHVFVAEEASKSVAAHQKENERKKPSLVDPQSRSRGTPATFQARRRRRHARDLALHPAQRKSKRRKAKLRSETETCARGLQSVEPGRPRVSRHFSNGRAEGATRMPRGGRGTNVELCNHGSNRLRSVPAAWIALTRHTWSRAARRSRAFAAGVRARSRARSRATSGVSLSSTASLLRPSIGREGLPLQRPERKVRGYTAGHADFVPSSVDLILALETSERRPASGQTGAERALICACPTRADGGCSSTPFSCRLRKLNCGVDSVFGFRSPAEALCMRINDWLQGDQQRRLPRSKKERATLRGSRSVWQEKRPDCLISAAFYSRDGLPGAPLRTGLIGCASLASCISALHAMRHAAQKTLVAFDPRTLRRDEINAHASPRLHDAHHRRPPTRVESCVRACVRLFRCCSASFPSDLPPA
jgi:hypothetical protein